MVRAVPAVPVVGRFATRPVVRPLGRRVLRGRRAVRFLVHFSRFTGETVFHCHIIAHEDGGMMGNLLIEK